MAQVFCSLYSYTLGHGVEISVTLPSFTSCDRKPGKEWTHKLEGKYPVIYLLHGMGNDYTAWLRYTSVERIAEEQRIALVTFSCGNKAYLNNKYGDNYYDFLNSELPEFVKENFPISDRPEDTYIAGLSMGGFGTLVHAFANPEKYRAYGAFSPGISVLNRPDPEYKDMFVEALDPAQLLEKDLKEGKELPAGFMCCGTEDFLYESIDGFQKKMRELGVDFVYHCVEGYGHEWPLWDIEVEKFIMWLPRTDVYVGKPRKV